MVCLKAHTPGLYSTRETSQELARLMRTVRLVGRSPHQFKRTRIADPSTQAQDLVKRQFRPATPDAGR
jgi:hypothetical protein